MSLALFDEPIPATGKGGLPCLVYGMALPGAASTFGVIIGDMRGHLSIVSPDDVALEIVWDTEKNEWVDVYIEAKRERQTEEG